MNKNFVARHIPVRNVSAHTITVRVEPWADEYRLNTGDSIELVFYGPASESPEVLIGDMQISVYGQRDSEVFVLRNNIDADSPTILDHVRRALKRHASIANSALSDALRVEDIDFVQAQLDAAPIWDKEGQDAAVLAALRIMPVLLTATKDERFTWEVGQRILRSRGVFLSLKPREVAELLSRLRKHTDNNTLYRWLQRRFLKAVSVDAG